MIGEDNIGDLGKCANMQLTLHLSQIIRKLMLFMFPVIWSNKKKPKPIFMVKTLYTLPSPSSSPNRHKHTQIIMVGGYSNI